MYFDWSAKKLSSLGLLIAVLLVSVYMTFFAKSAMYGNVNFAKIGTRLVSEAYHTTVYTLRGAALDGYLLASAITVQEDDESGKDPAHAVPVLIYHTIIDKPDGHNVTRDAFEAHMFALKKAGWQTITLEEFEAFMHGERQIPEKSFLLTFDDGARDSYYPVDPLLRALDYNAVTFILAKFSLGEGTNYYLSKGELSRMINSGRWEIGSHGHDIHHFVPISPDGREGSALANRMWLSDEARLETPEEYETRIREDLVSARRLLENTYRVPVTTFAFPFGDFGQLSLNHGAADETTREIAAETYDRSFYQYWRGDGFSYNYPSGNSSFAKRITVDPSWSSSDLLALLERGMPKDLPYEDTFDNPVEQSDWVAIWGDYRIEDGFLVLAAGPDTTGGSVILDGTAHWRNYRIHMEAESPEQTGVFVWVRFRDNNNNAACNFGRDFAHVEQVVDGVQRVIRGERQGTIIPDGPFTIDISASERTVTCGINGQTLVSTEFLDESLAQGGVGIKVWDPRLGRSSVIIQNFTVSSLASEN